jgi:DNA-directed RNA polymerase specialized sigma24 family protein
VALDREDAARHEPQEPPRPRRAPGPLTQGNLDGLLDWLDRDRARAGEKSEAIRRKLIRVFAARGCGEAEDLADETIDRVARRAREIAPAYEGDPASYFLGVANRVHLEYLKRGRARRAAPPPAPDAEEAERRSACLEECMARLAPHARELILRYHAGRGQAGADSRRALADELGVAGGNLRVRALRIRAALKECVVACLEGLGGA